DRAEIVAVDLRGDLPRMATGSLRHLRRRLIVGRSEGDMVDDAGAELSAGIASDRADIDRRADPRLAGGIAGPPGVLAEFPEAEHLLQHRFRRGAVLQPEGDAG